MSKIKIILNYGPIINEFNNSQTHFDDVIRTVHNLNYSGGTSRQRFFQIRGIGERSQYAGEGGPIYYVGTVIDDIDVSGIPDGIIKLTVQLKDSLDQLVATTTTDYTKDVVLPNSYYFLAQLIFFFLQ